MRGEIRRREEKRKIEQGNKKESEQRNKALTC